MVVLVGMLLQDAVTDGRIRHNPARGRRMLVLPKAEKPEIRPMTQQEWEAFRFAIRDTRFEVLFTLLGSTGLRPSEALGLGWEHVGFEGGVLHVQRQLAKIGDDGAPLFEPPKTKESRRDLPIPPALLRMLERDRARQAEERLRLGAAWVDYGLVFTSETGGPARGSIVSWRHFKNALKRAGLPSQIRLYDLRHTFATLMLQAGQDVKTVSKWLGHTQVAFTLDRYVHVLDETRREAAVLAAEVFLS